MVGTIWATIERKRLSGVTISRPASPSRARVGVSTTPPAARWGMFGKPHEPPPKVVPPQLGINSWPATFTPGKPGIWTVGRVNERPFHAEITALIGARMAL